ncbi:MAG: phosphate ABC transporter substrate-binding protein [Spirochaetales bacterium]|nr:phosphate ABC transporter substrate-binding protein [Spirochaetales bacterium]
MTAVKWHIICLIITGVSLYLISCNRKPGSSDQQEYKKAIQIKGSDTMVNLVQAWAEEFISNHPDVNLGITGGGSGTGIAALLNHSCDITMSSRSIEEKEMEEAEANNIHPVEFIVGLDGLIIIVNNENPVIELDLDQVRDIFLGRIDNWKNTGGYNSKIVILSRESNSGTYTFFKERVLKRGNKNSKEEFSPHALLMPSSQAIVNEISQNPHAIGYVGMGYAHARVKSLKLKDTSKPADADPVAPTIDNVLNGSYPISRPLFLYTNGEPSGNIKVFIDFALSERGQIIVRETDFVPIK